MKNANRRDFLKSSACVAGASILGASASGAELRGPLPTQFPRTIGPNALKYVQEVIDSGLTGAGGMVSRFEKAFAEALGVKHCMATPGCTPALAVLAAELLVVEAELEGVVAVRLLGLDLEDHAGADLEHRRGTEALLVVPDLGHPDFLSDKTLDHRYSPPAPKA